MIKRLAPALITLAAVIIGLIVYQFTSETPQLVDDKKQAPMVLPDDPVADPPSNTSTSNETKNSVRMGSNVRVSDVKSFKFTSRSPKGVIKNEFGFDHRNVNESGDHEFVNPWIKFYDKQQVVRITADSLETAVESEEKLPDSGSLKGDVQIEVYPLWAQQKDQPINVDDLDMLVELNQVDFQREFSQINSIGQVRLTSKQFSVLGSDLSVRYDQLKENHLQELVLRELEHLQFVNSTTPTSNNSEKVKPNSPPSPKQQKPPKPKTPNIYRISLTDQVKIIQENSLIEMDSLDIIAKDDFLKPETKTPLETKSNSTNANSNMALIDFNSSQTSLTCKGPLVITPATVDDLTDNASLSIQAQGSPINFWQNNQLSSTTLKLTYHDAINQIQLIGTKETPNKFHFAQDQWAHSILTTIDHRNGLATLIGPGIIQASNDNHSDTLHVKYDDRAVIKYDAKQKVEWIHFQGGIFAESTNGQIQSDECKLHFSKHHSSTKNSSTPIINSIDWKGQVFAIGQEFVFSGNRLVAEFNLNDEGKSELHQVKALESAKAESIDYIIKASENIIIEFDHTRNTTSTNQKDSLGVDTLLSQQNNIKYAIATGRHDGVQIIEKKNQNQILGDRLEGDFTTQQFKVYGQKAKFISPNKQNHTDQLESDVIIADLLNEKYSIPGNGKLTTQLSQSLSSSNSNSDTPVIIQWNKGATYHLSKNQIDLNDVQVEITQTDKKAKTTTNITTDILTVDLVETTSNSTSQSTNSREVGGFYAPGPIVQIESNQILLNSHEPVSLMAMEVPELRFDTSRSLLIANGAGWLHYMNYQSKPTKKAKPTKSQQPTTQINFFDSQQPAYTLLTFKEQLQFSTTNGEAIFLGDVTLDQIILDSNDLTLDTLEPHHLTKNIKRLSCDLLNVGLTQNNNTNKPPQEDPKENDRLQRISKINAQGHIVFELKDQKRHLFVAGKEFDYSNTTKTIQCFGTKDYPVIMDEVKFLEVIINLNSGAIDTIPFGHSKIVSNL